MPKFFADECVAALIVEGLRDRGFDVADAKKICQGDLPFAVSKQL